jgi:hypothetical protein
LKVDRVSDNSKLASVPGHCISLRPRRAIERWTVPPQAVSAGYPRRGFMAQKTQVTSDLSGTQIPEDGGAVLRIIFTTSERACTNSA